MGMTASFRFLEPFARWTAAGENFEALTGSIRFRQVPTEITLPA
jgi:hypothetical protein